MVTTPEPRKFVAVGGPMAGETITLPADYDPYRVVLPEPPTATREYVPVVYVIQTILVFGRHWRVLVYDGLKPEDRDDELAGALLNLSALATWLRAERKPGESPW